MGSEFYFTNVCKWKFMMPFFCCYSQDHVVEGDPAVQPQPAAANNPAPPPAGGGLRAAHVAMLQGGGPTGFQSYKRPQIFPFRVSFLLWCDVLQITLRVCFIDTRLFPSSRWLTVVSFSGQCLAFTQICTCEHQKVYNYFNLQHLQLLKNHLISFSQLWHKSSLSLS